MTLVNVPFLLLRYSAVERTTALGLPILAVDEQDVGPAVAVRVEEGAAGANGLGQILLARPPCVVDEGDPRGGGRVGELDGVGGSRGNSDTGGQENQQQQLGVVHMFECVGDSTGAPIVETH